MSDMIGFDFVFGCYLAIAFLASLVLFLAFRLRLASSEINRLLMKCESSDVGFLRRQSEIDELIRDLKSKDEAIVSLDAKVLAKSLELNYSLQNISSLEAENARLKVHSQTLETSSGRLRALSQELDLATSSVSELKAAMAELSSENRRLHEIVNNGPGKNIVQPDVALEFSAGDVSVRMLKAADKSQRHMIEFLKCKIESIVEQRDALQVKIAALEQEKGKIADNSIALSIANQRVEMLDQIVVAKDSDIARLADDLKVCDGERNRLENSLKQSTSELESLVLALDKSNAERLRLVEVVAASDQIENIQEKLEAFEDQHELVAAGLYPIPLDFGTPDELKLQLEALRSDLGRMIREKTAVICETKWSINGSQAEGTKATRHYVRIMLRTFNADADACLDLVRWNNLDKCEARLRSSFDYVNELGATHHTSIQNQYLEVRLAQLRLMYQYRESLYRKREAMRVARQSAQEERKAAREIEKARNEADLEEKRYEKALARARDEVSGLAGPDREAMLGTIASLESKLAEVALLKQRAISMAQITKAGFVYVVSNIGSFGMDVLKIGMTRRIDPQERIRELGGASVPFGFDVHAMIYSDNAPELEGVFHKRFSSSRINLANGRKEFFRIPLDDVINFASELALSAEFAREPEARDFRFSSHMRKTMSDDEISQKLIAMEENISLDEDEEPEEEFV
jgi:hypothetical protein